MAGPDIQPIHTTPADKTMTAATERQPIANHDRGESSTGQVAERLSSESNAIKEIATKSAQIAEAKQDKSVQLLTSVSEELDEAITILNESLAKTPTRAVISKDEVLNRFIVKIADKRSGEIVREVPPEALLKFARQLQEIKGILYDEST
jgi:flagellar protein FlaG